MKKLLITVGFAAAFAPAIAQHHEHGPSYQKSVFSGHEQVGVLNREMHEATRAKVRQNFPGWKLTTDKVTGNFSDIYGDAMAVSGQSPLEMSQAVMNTQLKALGISKAEWNLVRDAAAPKAHYVDYEQVINGHKVMFTKLSFRFTKDGRLVRVNNTSFGKAIKSTTPVLTKADVATSASILEDAVGVSLSSVDVASDWVWFPVPAQNGYTLQPAWEFTAKGVEGEGMPVELNGFIDAITGELLYRSNEVKTISDVQVKGTVYKTNYISPATLEPMGNIEVVLGSTTVNADDTGYVSSATDPVNATFKIKGLWSTVVPSGSTTPSFQQTITGTGNIYALSPDTGVIGRAVSAYYHTNRAHENMKALLPGFTDMDISLTTNTELNGTCNAFYNGSSINFYSPGGGCPSFAEIGDIVYHEYGHGINRSFYADQGVSSMRNGALNEGYADVWGMTITKDSVLGRGAKGGTTTFIRRYDQDHKVYPTNIVGEVHADGEIIAGAWWDVARNIGSYETMAEIFAEAFYDVADGPNGMEGPVYHKVLISAILSDDNDATLSNGTPHLQQIVEAFAKHGIYLYADAKLTHQEIAHQPQNTPITVNASLALTNSDFFQSLTLYYRNRTVGSWDSLAMTDNGGFNFTAQIPAQPQGALVDYYFGIFNALTATSVNFPEAFTRDISMANRSNIPYQFAVGVSNRVQITFEEETLDDWEIGLTSDKATGGKWIHAKPVGTTYSPNGGAFGSFITQTNKDHTSGSGKCLVTANGTSLSNGDVDGGTTTVYTPVFELWTYVNPIVEYYRWFSNDRSSGQESNRRKTSWLTYIRIPNGNWVKPVESTLQADHSWRRRVFAVDEYLPGERAIQMRFAATDNTTTPGIVEAAIDDFFIYDGVPTSVGDVTPQKANIYPNPADEEVTISLPQAIKGSIAVYDLMGKQVALLQMGGAKTSYVLKTGHLAAGQYMLIIQGDNKTIQNNKLLVTHK